MRYLIWKPVAVVSRWMSEARRCRALKMVVSTRRTMGASSLSVRRSRSSTSSSQSSSCMTCTLRASPASSITFWPLSDFLSTSWIWARGAPAKRRGRFNLSRSMSWVGMSRGSAMASHRMPSRSCTGTKWCLNIRSRGRAWKSPKSTGSRVRSRVGYNSRVGRKSFRSRSLGSTASAGTGVLDVDMDESYRKGEGRGWFDSGKGHNRPPGQV